MMEDGASPYQIDAAVRDFGFPMGPFQVVGPCGRRHRLGRDEAPRRDARPRSALRADRRPPLRARLVRPEDGRGFYLYPEGSRTGTPDPEVEAIIDAERARAGITPRNFTDEEIMRRYMAAMINEGANVVHEGIALRPLDVDVTFLYGYGFPRYRGGPMKYADTVGLRERCSPTSASSRKKIRASGEPSPLLVELVERGADFASLNQTS